VLRVGAYYTVRELSTATPELWALRSLGHEVLLPGNGGGDSWMREQLGPGISPCWQCPLSKGPIEVDASFDGGFDSAVCVDGLSRLANWYVEGVAAALNPRSNLFLDLDALYYDGIGFSNLVMRRVRRLLDQAVRDRRRTAAGGGKTASINSTAHRDLTGRIDLHCGNNFLGNQYGMVSPALQFMGLFPYVDSLWLGEGASYERDPAYWLVEVSGIPFGQAGDTMRDQNVFRSMLFGMAARPSTGHPQSLWRMWSAMGFHSGNAPHRDPTRLRSSGTAPPITLGWWEDDPVVVAECDGRISEEVLSSAFVLPGISAGASGQALVVMASWASEEETCNLWLNWSTLAPLLNVQRRSSTRIVQEASLELDATLSASAGLPGLPSALDLPRLWAPTIVGVQSRVPPLALEFVKGDFGEHLGEATRRDSRRDSIPSDDATDSFGLRSEALRVKPGGGLMLVLDIEPRDGVDMRRPFPGPAFKGNPINTKPSEEAASHNTNAIREWPPPGASESLVEWQDEELVLEEAQLEAAQMDTVPFGSDPYTMPSSVGARAQNDSEEAARENDMTTATKLSDGGAIVGTEWILPDR